MHYTLQGKIAQAHPYQLDKTLSVPGAGAEAESTGKAIEEIKKNHISNKENPHNVTKAQVGLGDVDNTSDNNKPVSFAQAEAIAAAKKAGTDARIVADSKAAMATTTVTLSESKWSNKAQTVDVSDITENDAVIVTPAPDSYNVAVNAGLYCSAQGSGTLSFACTTTPTVAITCNILILK